MTIKKLIQKKKILDYLSKKNYELAKKEFEIYFKKYEELDVNFIISFSTKTATNLLLIVADS
jgi:hypothetical protein